MTQEVRTYLAIDLKSFYASVECVERGLDPLKAKLVVADESRTDKTICLAVSPALKEMGVSGRPRLFEVRKLNTDFIVATPRMANYLEVSGRIYAIYLRFIAPEDIHVYSIDEVFIDATEYLRLYKTTAHDLAMMLIRTVLKETGITATAGIGPNLYLAKVAMDIEAKHSPPDKDGVRIASLDEMSYRRKYWTHRPLTDFWRIGHGTVQRLEKLQLYTLGDVARRSVQNEESLYKAFGVNAELLIDHAWGWEPCTLEHIKAYKPHDNSISSGQVLPRPYSFEQAAVIVREMTDQLVMDLVERRLVTDQVILAISYERHDSVHGSINLGCASSSTIAIVKAASKLFSSIANPSKGIRRISVTMAHVRSEDLKSEVQLSLFGQEEDSAAAQRERRQQEAILKIRQRFGKNAILKGMNFEEGATARERNKQIGGHKA